MRVWTNGTLHVARSRKGLYVLLGNQILRFVEILSEDSSPWFLAVEPSGLYAWIEGLRRISLEDGSIESTPMEGVLDAVGRADGVFALLEAASGLRLVEGIWGKPWSREVELIPNPLPTIVLPGLDLETAQLSAEDLWKTPAQRVSVSLRASPSGVALVDPKIGMIGIFRDGTSTKWLRIPHKDIDYLDAVVIAQGVLISLRAAGRGFVFHTSDEGVRDGGLELQLPGVGGIPLSEGRFVVFDGTKGRLKIFRMEDFEDLHPRSRLSLPNPPLDVSSSPDGCSVVFSTEETLSIFEMGEKRLALASCISLEATLREAELKAREKQRIEQGNHYKRPDGPPSLGFPVSKVPIPLWEAVPGEILTLSLLLRSTGGAGRGVFVELSGPALDQGLVEPMDLEITGEQARFHRTGNSWSCSLEAIQFPQGIQFPFDPKPKNPEQVEKAQALLAATHLSFQVRLLCKSAGSSMLSIATRPCEGRSVPVKWTRLLAVR